MKLRNKKTGEIKDWSFSEALSLWMVGRSGPDGCSLEGFIANIERFRNEWEVASEGKEWPQIDDGYFYITWAGEVRIDSWVGCDIERHSLEIGNVFRTREEAEKAVEKLKAWQRLKDKGFRFNRWVIPEEPKTQHIKLVIEAEMDVPDSPYDLDLLFGDGEE